jgi:hypothetical protein
MIVRDRAFSIPRPAALLSLFLLAAAPAPLPIPAGPDWGATLRMDAQALHDDIAANHPGPVNAEDPDFGRLNDAQLRLAIERSATARSLSGYFYALRAYVAAFDDGHLAIGLFGRTQSELNWPGFLTRYGNDDEQRVAVVAENSPVPLGARLVSCDGRPAYRLAQENVGQFFGRWSLLSQRLALGSSLFVDHGNPYVSRPARCTFEVEGSSRDVALDWQPIDLVVYNIRRQSLGAAPVRAIAARTLADGTRWVSMSSFDGNPASFAGMALPSLIVSLRGEQARLAAAPAIVLDLRGNGGGSSDWSRQIAEILWGRGARDRAPRATSRVDWRVSAANLASLRTAREQQIVGGALSPAMRRWFDRVIEGLEGALARGEALWRQPEDSGGAGEALPGSAAAPPALRGPVYVVTDAACASACIDAVEQWRALGAVHIGQATSADTFYMDIRNERLPSELGSYSVPRKVYRGRSRGSNEPVVPAHAFTGNIADTPALERWISSLPERRR